MELFYSVIHYCGFLQKLDVKLKTTTMLYFWPLISLEDTLLEVLQAFFGLNCKILVDRKKNKQFPHPWVVSLAYLYPRKLCLWWVYCFHVVRPSVRQSVTFCFLNILKSNCWIFIKPCKQFHICKTNTLDKKVRARGQFY